MQHLENFPLDLKEVHLFMIQRFVCVDLKVHFSISDCSGTLKTHNVWHASEITFCNRFVCVFVVFYMF